MSDNIQYKNNKNLEDDKKRLQKELLDLEKQKMKASHSEFSQDVLDNEYRTKLQSAIAKKQSDKKTLYIALAGGALLFMGPVAIVFGQAAIGIAGIKGTFDFITKGIPQKQAEKLHKKIQRKADIKSEFISKLDERINKIRNHLSELNTESKDNVNSNPNIKKENQTELDKLKKHTLALNSGTNEPNRRQLTHNSKIDIGNDIVVTKNNLTA